MSATVLDFPPLMGLGQRLQKTLCTLFVFELPTVRDANPLVHEPGFATTTMASFLDPTEALIAYAMAQRESGVHTLH
jgi:hypothetical protein